MSFFSKIKSNMFIRKVVFGWTKKGREKLKKEKEWYRDRRFVRDNAERLKNSIVDNNYKYKEKFREEISYIKKNNECKMYNYEWSEKYKNQEIDVYEDTELNLKYVIHKGKKLYFPKSYGYEAVKEGYRGLILEQDKESPHRYLCNRFDVKGGVFCDIGCAEAMTSLEVIDDVDKVILFECSKEWKEALNATFLPYANKVVLIDKFCGDEIDTAKTTLDETIDLLKITNDQPIWVKMDVEGAELSVLKGAQKVLENFNNVHLACTTYHNQNDDIVISEFAELLKLNYSFSSNWIVFIYDLNGQKEPYFRHGLIYISK